MINVALVIVIAIAIVRIERDQIVRAPIGKLMLVDRGTDGGGRARADRDRAWRRRRWVAGDVWIGAVQEFVEVRQAIAVWVAVWPRCWC